MEFDNQELSATVKYASENFHIVFDESRHVTGVLSAPFTDAMATIVLLTSDSFLKWLIILNILLLSYKYMEPMIKQSPILEIQHGQNLLMMFFSIG